MSDLVVIGFGDEHKAFALRAELAKLQKEYLIEMEDVVVVTKDELGRVKLHQSTNLIAEGAVSGGFWGLLFGVLFRNPLLGVAAGAGIGALGGKMADAGMDDRFIRKLGKALHPESSALFVLVRHVTPDKVLEALKGFGGNVIKTSLTADKEEALRAVLNGS